jgi:ribosome biogenesis GTPase / thiamine phosphate phosphatase
MESHKGRVIRSTGSWYDILDADGFVWKGRLRGKFKLGASKITNPIAVGDQVVFEPEPSQADHVIITQILPRTNYIIRKSVHKTGHGQIIASNIDLGVLIASLFMPRTSLGFIDRFLVSAESFGIPVLIVFNKNDLLNPEDKEYLQVVENLYMGLGYGCISTSVVSGSGIDALKNRIEGTTALFSGHSGVGKSSLLNVLAPNLHLPTGKVSEYAEKGTHTTTFAEMFPLWEDTYIIDTPGIKELGMLDMENLSLAHFFPEMRQLMNQCKFDNCTHEHEPGCVVKQAVNDSAIALTRYNSYLSMLHEEDNRR